VALPYSDAIFPRPERLPQNISYNDAMPNPVLATKLFIPRPRPNVVLRADLITRLNAGLHRRLTLISAPAGFGKTTLVASWLAHLERKTQTIAPASSDRLDPVRRSAWLSLDAGDTDLTRFLTYLVAALQTIGASVVGLLQSPPPPAEAILTALLNAVSAVPDPFILVLDDYHVIDSPSVDQALTFLIEHLPPQMHLVIATREDPHLPLARFRARDQLTELRAADLRFTPAEATAFLNQAMGLSLSAGDIAALAARTEGWIAGLQLAALALQGPLSMHGLADTSRFIQSFTGSHRFVLDYLVEEVLQQQPEHIRSFLLQTSLLDRLCGPLCDAVTGQKDSRVILETLERGNLFIVPLDAQRQWYRYHHLFAEVLQAHLQEAHPDRVPMLHLRASEWYEQHDLRSDAIGHALAARDFEGAAGLIELAKPAIDLNYQSSIWLGWLKALPDDLIRTRPVLSVGYAWALLDGGELEASEAHLQEAERWLNAPADKMVVVDTEQFRSLPASIATARAYRSLALGDVSGTVAYAQQALELTSADDRIRYMQAISLLGLAQYTNGDLQVAERSLADFYTNLRKTGEISTLVSISFLLADIRVALGRLHEAESIYQQSLQLATSQGAPMPLGIVDVYRGLAELYVERGDLEAAAQHLLTSQKLGAQTTLTDWPYRLCVSQARLHEAQGNLEGALALLDQAERVHIRSPLPDVRPIAALKTRIWLKQGRLSEALAWARKRGLSADDDISYTREFEHIVLARVLIAAGTSESDRAAVSRLLGRLLQAAEAGGRLGSVIEILVVQALAFQAHAHLAHALASLERAVALAEPQGYLRIFVDEGEAMRSLIEKQSRNRGQPLSGYMATLLAAFAQPVAAQPSALTGQPSGMIEPLSEREQDVLKLLRGDLSGPEIAQQLSVSLHTLRTHTNNIFKKLGVNNRRAAVRRAEELDLY
jgi:LuxR family maltose regulon positive regulatory protein